MLKSPATKTHTSTRFKLTNFFIKEDLYDAYWVKTGYQALFLEKKKKFVVADVFGDVVLVVLVECLSARACVRGDELLNF